MERVSYPVAKALKEAGYPQGQTDKVYIDADCYDDKVGTLVEHPENYWEGDIVDAPTYLEAWLWLWRERHEFLECESNSFDYMNKDEGWKSMKFYIRYDNGYGPTSGFMNNCKSTDPEEAIIAAIEYLVDNNLIK